MQFIVLRPLQIGFWFNLIDETDPKAKRREVNFIVLSLSKIYLKINNIELFKYRMTYILMNKEILKTMFNFIC